MRYVELHCKSNFSFLRGASHPDELVTQAAALGYAGLALTDSETLAGVVRGFGAARDLDFKYVIGAEVHPIDAPSLVLWPTDRAAYGRLCQLLSRGRLRREKGACELMWDDVVEFGDGMIAGALPVHSGPGTDQPKRDLADFDENHAGLPAKAPRPGLTVDFLRNDFRTAFPQSAYLLCALHDGVDDRQTLTQLHQISLQSGVPLVASGDVYYHTAGRMLMHDCVTAIRNATTIDQIHQQRFANSQHHLRSLDEIRSLFADIPGAIERTDEIAQRCRFSLAELRYEYPEEIAPPGMSLIEHLKRLAWEGAKQRWPHGVPDRMIDCLRHETELIEELHYEAYF